MRRVTCFYPRCLFDPGHSYHALLDLERESLVSCAKEVRAGDVTVGCVCELATERSMCSGITLAGVGFRLRDAGSTYSLDCARNLEVQ